VNSILIQSLGELFNIVVIYSKHWSKTVSFGNLVRSVNYSQAWSLRADATTYLSSEHDPLMLHTLLEGVNERLAYASCSPDNCNDDHFVSFR
jgi:hypothetical protein